MTRCGVGRGFAHPGRPPVRLSTEVTTTANKPTASGIERYLPTACIVATSQSATDRELPVVHTETAYPWKAGIPTNASYN